MLCDAFYVGGPLYPSLQPPEIKGMLIRQLQHILILSLEDLLSRGFTGFAPLLCKEHAKAVLFAAAAKLLLSVPCVIL